MHGETVTPAHSTIGSYDYQMAPPMVFGIIRIFLDFSNMNTFCGPSSP